MKALTFLGKKWSLNAPPCTLQKGDLRGTYRREDTQEKKWPMTEYAKLGPRDYAARKAGRHQSWRTQSGRSPRGPVGSKSHQHLDLDFPEYERINFGVFKPPR